jgi:hypothetical protein
MSEAQVLTQVENWSCTYHPESLGEATLTRLKETLLCAVEAVVTRLNLLPRGNLSDNPAEARQQVLAQLKENFETAINANYLSSMRALMFSLTRQGVHFQIDGSWAASIASELPAQANRDFDFNVWVDEAAIEKSMSSLSNIARKAGDALGFGISARIITNKLKQEVADTFGQEAKVKVYTMDEHAQLLFDPTSVRHTPYVIQIQVGEIKCSFALTPVLEKHRDGHATIRIDPFQPRRDAIGQNPRVPDAFSNGIDLFFEKDGSNPKIKMDTSRASDLWLGTLGFTNGHAYQIVAMREPSFVHTQVRELLMYLIKKSSERMPIVFDPFLTELLQNSKGRPDTALVVQINKPQDPYIYGLLREQADDPLIARSYLDIGTVIVQMQQLEYIALLKGRAYDDQTAQVLLDQLRDFYRIYSEPSLHVHCEPFERMLYALRQVEILSPEIAGQLACQLGELVQYYGLGKSSWYGLTQRWPDIIKIWKTSIYDNSSSYIDMQAILRNWNTISYTTLGIVGFINITAAMVDREIFTRYVLPLTMLYLSTGALLYPFFGISLAHYLQRTRQPLIRGYHFNEEHVGSHHIPSEQHRADRIVFTIDTLAYRFPKSTL